MDSSAKIGVLTKIVAIMDALARAEGSVTFSELSRQLNIPRPTLHRLIAAMREESLIDVQGGRFVLGPRLVEWSTLAVHTSDLRQAALGSLERLVQLTGETASLYVRVGHQRICLDRVDGPGLLRPAIRIGEALPLHVGSAGRVILAWSDPLEWDELWTLSEREFPTEDAVNPPDWWAIRRQGWVISVRERDDALSSVSVPVLGARGELIAALSVSGPLSRLPRDRLREFVPWLRAAAEAVRDGFESGGAAGPAHPARAASPADPDAAGAWHKRRRWRLAHPRSPS